jgi:bla regulator protein blaR1
MPILLEAAVRVTLIAAALAFVLRLLRVHSPAVRHALWTALVMLMLLLPALTTWGPDIPIQMLPPPPRPTPVIATMTVPIRIGDFATTGEDFVPIGAPQHSPISALPWMTLLALVYAVGVVVLGLRLLTGSWQARALVRRATFFRGRLTSPGCATPVTIGFFSPTMILPTAWPTWPQNKLDAILAHEAVHVRRRDPLIQWIALLNRAIFWFHPLAWWLQQHVARLAEEACDAAVLADGHDPITYSQVLLECAETAALAGGRVQAVGMTMPGAVLSHRIEQILTASQHRPTSRRRVVCAALLCMIAGTIFVAAKPAQAPPTSPAFEVASLKRNSTVGGMLVLPPTPGLLRLINHPLSGLIASAYGVSEDQVVGPNWIRSARFDLLAKTGNSLPAVYDGPNSVRPMLRTLLEERFKLAVHHETKSVDKYALVMARSDGRLGPRLKRSATDCDAVKAQRAAPSAPGGPCGMLGSADHLIADSVSLSSLTGFLVGAGKFVDRDVVDQTGLVGRFSFNLDLDPSVSIFTALQEELGLKLKATAVPSDVVVIDHVEELIEN